MDEYEKAVKVETLKENAQKVYESVKGLQFPEGMDAIGAAMAQIWVECWANQTMRLELFDKFIQEQIRPAIEDAK